MLNEVAKEYRFVVPFLELRYFSNALGIQTACNVIVPAMDVPAPYHVMVLLHGLSDDHTIWCRRTSIERYVDGLPMIVVMPNGGRGWYTDADEGSAYYSAIAMELSLLIEHLFPTKTPWCVTGLSMGGYGALKLALSNPTRFVSAVSHSGALKFGNGNVGHDGGALPAEFQRILGKDAKGGPNDLFALASALRPVQRPKLRIDCGTEDFLIESNRAYRQFLEEIGYVHEYDEFPGAHTWSYWDEHVQQAIQFHLRNLNN